MTTQKPILTGLHALLCPELIYTGFKVFSPEKINLLCSVTHTGSFTDLGENFNKSCKKAEGLLPLSFHFWIKKDIEQLYEFFIFDHVYDDGLVYAWWRDEERIQVLGEYPIWEAVQKFEKEMQAKYAL